MVGRRDTLSRVEALLTLFVYGSLRKGHANHHLLEGAEFIGSGTIEAALYVRGDTLMAHEGPGAVRGEAYRLRDVYHLHALDGFEGHPARYVRRTAHVVLEDGRTVDAWCYFKAERDPESTPAVSGTQWVDNTGMHDERTVLRHIAATLAYRAAKVLRDAPAQFQTTDFGPATRRPVQIVAHMADLMTWGVSIARGGFEWKAEGGDDWKVEVDRFFAGLAALDRALAADGPFTGSVEKLIQGPLADALTHVGQLAMLRGMAGFPVRPESYARADIKAGRVGLEQSPAGKEFDGDASSRRRG